ncbi:MAG: hypothetical protein U0835_07400 [Isosphaeraceae bacterium]
MNDLTAYLRSLRPLPGRSTEPNEAVERGRAAFLARKCDACHAPPSYTTPKSYDVGLTDEVGNTKFNPPSLRGVGVRALFSTAARPPGWKTYSSSSAHPRGVPMTPAEASDLIAFLGAFETADAPAGRQDRSQRGPADGLGVVPHEPDGGPQLARSPPDREGLVLASVVDVQDRLRRPERDEHGPRQAETKDRLPELDGDRMRQAP